MEQHVSSLAHALPGRVFLSEDQEYTESLASYFSAQESQLKPACIIRPQSTEDVATVFSYLVQANKSLGIGSVKFAVRSGGHACIAESANLSDGVTIDLRSLNTIELNDDSSQVLIGTGASWGEVYRKLDPLGLAVPGGRHSQVGVGGLTLGGGLSHFSSHIGLVCDNVLEYKVVLASGATVQATENNSEYGDLFRALRGGSNNFGIIAQFTFRTFRQGRMWGGTLMHSIETKDQQLQAFYNYANNPSPDPNASLIHSVGMSAERGSGVVNSVVYTKPESEPAVIKPFLELKPIAINTLRELSLTELTREQDAFNQNGLCQIMISTTYYLDLPLLNQTHDLWRHSYDAVQTFAGIMWSISFQLITPVVISRSPFLQQAIPTLSDNNNNRPIVVAQLCGTWKEMKDTAAVEAVGKELIHDIDVAAEKDHKQTGYIYLNYSHAGQNVFGEGRRKQWLQEVSRKYDPEGLFQRCVTGGIKLF